MTDRTPSGKAREEEDDEEESSDDENQNVFYKSKELIVSAKLSYL